MIWYEYEIRYIFMMMMEVKLTFSTKCFFTISLVISSQSETIEKTSRALRFIVRRPIIAQ